MFRKMMVIASLATVTALARTPQAEAARFTHVGPHGYTHWAGGVGGWRGGYWHGGYWRPGYGVGAAVATGAVAGAAVGVAARNAAYARSCYAYHPYYPYAYCGPY